MASKMSRLAILFASGMIQSACSAAENTSNDSTQPVQPAANASVTAGRREPQQAEGAMQIRIRTGKTVLTARLEDSAAARDFAALLPLQLALKDYAATEKIADLPRKLSTEGAAAGVDPDVGDIAYYAPWGNLAIYYRDFGYSPGLVLLGRVETGADALGSLEGPVTIETAR